MTENARLLTLANILLSNMEKQMLDLGNQFIRKQYEYVLFYQSDAS